MDNFIIQISAGKGPAECCRVVAKVLELMLKQAAGYGMTLQVLDTKKGDLNGTLLSATLKAKGKDLSAFKKAWEGTIL